jgi:hypothetical protein
MRTKARRPIQLMYQYAAWTPRTVAMLCNAVQCRVQAWILPHYRVSHSFRDSPESPTCHALEHLTGTSETKPWYSKSSTTILPFKSKCIGHIHMFSRCYCGYSTMGSLRYTSEDKCAKKPFRFSRISALLNRPTGTECIRLSSCSQGNTGLSLCSWGRL